MNWYAVAWWRCNLSRLDCKPNMVRFSNIAQFGTMVFLMSLLIGYRFETDVKYAFVHYYRWIESAAFWTWKKNTSQRGIWDTVEKKSHVCQRKKQRSKPLPHPSQKKLTYKTGVDDKYVCHNPLLPTLFPWSKQSKPLLTLLRPLSRKSRSTSQTWIPLRCTSRSRLAASAIPIYTDWLQTVIWSLAMNLSVKLLRLDLLSSISRLAIL